MSETLAVRRARSDLGRAVITARRYPDDPAVLAARDAARARYAEARAQHVVVTALATVEGLALAPASRARVAAALAGGTA